MVKVTYCFCLGFIKMSCKQFTTHMFSEEKNESVEWLFNAFAITHFEDNL